MDQMRTDVDLLMRSAEELLLVATDEARLLAAATELLGEQYGYGARYVLLHDAATAELYVGGAAGKIADTTAINGYRRPDHAGLTGACWTSGAIVNVADVRSDPRYMEVLPSCRSEICVPIVAGTAVLGVLGIQSERAADFSEHDERLLAAYARLVAMGLTHARQHQARQKDIAELQALTEVAQRGASLDLRATLEAVCDSYRRLTTSDSVAVYLWDPRTERLSASALSFDAALYRGDYEQRVRERQLALGEGMIGWSALHREPLRIDNVAEDPRPIAVQGTPLASKSAIVIPLFVEDKLVGVARAVKMGIAAYTDDHYRFAQRLASQAALAIAAAAAHEEIRRLSVTDELTGAYNASHVMQRLREHVELARRDGAATSLLIVDGDRIKNMNDRHGHADGNRLLVALTETLRAQLRTSDVLGRFGGDEFMIVLPHTNAIEALIVAQRLRKAVADTDYRSSSDERMRVTVSVGLATFPDDGVTADEVFRAADRSLYRAKDAGRNRVGSA